MRRNTTPACIIILLVLFINTTRLYSQIVPWEEIYLHIDRDKYIAGEDIWFSIYSIDKEKGSLSDRSTVAYIELLNPWNRTVFQTRFQLSGGRGAGNFSLPDSISSGTYTVRAYTNWMKNFLPENCYMHDIEIFNPLRNSDFMRKTSLISNHVITDAETLQGLTNLFNLNADTIYGRREKVTLDLNPGNSIESQLLPVDISISVTPAIATEGSYGIENYLADRNKKMEETKLSVKPPYKYSFESNGHNLSVRIKYREDNISDSCKYLYMSIQGKVAEFRYAVGDSSGIFNFLLPVDYQLRNLILQPEHADNNMILEIEPSFSWILPASSGKKETLTDSQIDIFSELSFNYQAARIYGTILKKEASADATGNPKKRRFYGIPEMEVFLADYISLPSMQEVFFELLPGIIIRMRKSEYEMKITNPLTGVFYDEPPLIMIDGVIINDMSVLVDLNPELVEKIEVVKTPYLIGDLILHGIVNVITRQGNFHDLTMPEYAVILPYKVVEVPSIIEVPDYTDENSRMKRTPDLRNTLYWNPSVKTDKNGVAKIQFWTSDLPGNYIINIQGISANGKKISLHKSFSVK